MIRRPRWEKIKALYAQPEDDAVVLPRELHKLSRKMIDSRALVVLKTLDDAGFRACLVGGGVRDLLLKREPKDFDVATNATPEQVRKIFKNSRIIGRRFRIVHVYVNREIIEVSTFRANRNNGDTTEMLGADNVYGTIAEDATRRDFTINALFYNYPDQTLVDFTAGMLDIQRCMLRMIGDPEQRYHEDPVRLLRALRLSAKLQFTIEPETAEPLGRLSHLLSHVPKARIFDEMIKLFFTGHAKASFDSLVAHNYLKVFFPELAEMLAQREVATTPLIDLALEATDHRFHHGLSLNPGFLLSIFLWPVLQDHIEINVQKGKLYHALHLSIEEVMTRQTETIAIPRRLSAMIRSIWLLQYHLKRRREDRVERVVSHRYFRAAFDFLELRSKLKDEAAEELRPLVKWWRKHKNAVRPPKRRSRTRHRKRKRND